MKKIIKCTSPDSEYCETCPYKEICEVKTDENKN